MTVEAKLLTWRKAQGLSQREAAERASMTQAAWSAIESGRWRNVSLRTAMALVRTTDGAVQLEDFVSTSEA